MRLLHSVLRHLNQSKKPQRQFVAHLLGLMLMLPGHATFRNMSRYSPYHERTFARWYDTDLDWVHSTRPPSPMSSLLRMIRPWSSMPVSCPKVASTPMALIASGTVAIVARKKGSKSRRELGSISRVTAPTASVWSRPHQVLVPLSRRPPAWMSMRPTQPGSHGA